MSSQCLNCHSTCETCVNDASTGCTGCKPSHTFNPTLGTCTPFTCFATGNCQGCFGPRNDQCRDSPPGFYIDFNNLVTTYTKMCQSGEYLDASNNCQTCDAACFQCNAAGRAGCTICRSGFFRWNSVCTNNPNSCDLQNGWTIDFSNSDSCVQCVDSNCLSCQDRTKCNYCRNGFHPTATTQVCAPCSPNTIYCQQAIPGRGWSLRCLAGFFFGSSNNCTRMCVQNQYWDSITNCVNCSAKCRTCIANPNNCDSCYAGDIFFNPLNCAVYSNTAFGAYYLDTATNTAKRCNLPCETCNSNGGNICLSCIGGFYFDGSVCLRCDPRCNTEYLYSDM